MPSGAGRDDSAECCAVDKWSGGEGWGGGAAEPER